MSENTGVTVKAVAQEARRLAQQFPDRVAACTYVHYVDGEKCPNCIVGQAFANLGITLDELENHDSCSIRHLAGSVPGWMPPEWLNTTGEDAELYVDWLGYLQGRQDGGNSWGAALAYADRRMVMVRFDI